MILQRVLFLTNDDGYDSEGITSLISELHAQGIPLLVIAPSENRSASSLSLTLHRDLILERQRFLEEELARSDAPLVIHSLDGSPADCSLMLDYGLRDGLFDEMMPLLAHSGVNLGANVSQDVLHSGTVGAARQASMTGIPTLASSLCSFKGVGLSSAISLVTSLLVQLWGRVQEEDVSAVKASFREGRIYLNLNVPSEWNGDLATCSLGIREYRNALQIQSNGSGEDAVTCRLSGPVIHSEAVDGTDVGAIEAGVASLSVLPTWPYSHPLFPTTQVLDAASIADSEGWPAWIGFRFDPADDGRSR